jgi:hypothetical protein
MRSYTYLNGINGVAAGGTATVNVPVNYRYHSFDIFLGDTGVPDSTEVSEIRLTVNGVLMQRFTPARLLALALLEGIPTVAGHLYIPFSSIVRATVAGEEATAWDLYGQNKAEIAVDFKATATAPTLKIGATWDEQRNVINGVPFIQPVKRLTQTFNPGAGAFDIDQIPNTLPIQRLYFESSQVVSSCEVYVGTTKVFEGSLAENNAALKSYGLDGSQFAYAVVFDREHQVTSALDCANRDAAGKIVSFNNLLIRPVMATAGVLTVAYDQRANGYN